MTASNQQRSVFGLKSVRTHKVPLWIFRLLAKIGLAKRYNSIDPTPDYNGFWGRIEMYRVFGTYYIAKEEIFGPKGTP